MARENQNFVIETKKISDQELISEFAAIVGDKLEEYGVKNLEDANDSQLQCAIREADKRMQITRGTSPLRGEPDVSFRNT